nr:hypothetical protein [uncultured Porphyromonas sp.]
MKKRSVDEELKMLQAEAARDLSALRSRIQCEWRWIGSPEGKDEIWENVRRDVLPQRSLAQWIFRVFSKDRGKKGLHPTSRTISPGDILSSSIIGKMLPASWVRFAPLAEELFDLLRPFLVSSALALGRNTLERGLARLNPFRRKKRSK